MSSAMPDTRSGADKGGSADGAPSADGQLADRMAMMVEMKQQNAKMEQQNTVLLAKVESLESVVSAMPMTLTTNKATLLQTQAFAQLSQRSPERAQLLQSIMEADHAQVRMRTRILG